MADLKEVMMRQYGPAPVWTWTLLATSFIVGFVVLRKRMNPGGPTTSTTGGGQGGEFSSGMSTTTTDANGNQISTNYSASGPLTGIPGYLTQQAGPMPYSGGDVYVNYPSAPTPPPAQTTNSDSNKRTVLNPDFNEVGWSDKAKQSPWTMTVAQSGETWKDITARIYGFASNYASVTDPANKQRIDQVAAYLRNENAKWTGEVPDGSGPTPGSVVVYR